MPAHERIRILSDLHLGHPATHLESVEQLTPLCRGVSRIIFNGDTVEMRYRSERESAQKNQLAVSELCRANGVEPVFLNGNHDPFLSAQSHLDLANGEILVTHGDILYHSASPWSREADVIAKAHTQALEALEEILMHDFEHRLAVGKRAILAVELGKPDLAQGAFAKLLLFVMQLWPPWKPFQILGIWMNAHRKAAQLAEQFRPDARFVIFGHTHHAGIWRIGQRVIINTGGFFPGSRCFAVDLEGDELIVQRIVRRASEFQIDREIARFSLAPR